MKNYIKIKPILSTIAKWVGDNWLVTCDRCGSSYSVNAYRYIHECDCDAVLQVVDAEV